MEVCEQKNKQPRLHHNSKALSSHSAFIFPRSQLLPDDMCGIHLLFSCCLSSRSARLFLLGLFFKVHQISLLGQVAHSSLDQISLLGQVAHSSLGQISLLGKVAHSSLGQISLLRKVAHSSLDQISLLGKVAHSSLAILGCHTCVIAVRNVNWGLGESLLRRYLAHLAIIIVFESVSLLALSRWV